MTLKTTVTHSITALMCFMSIMLPASGLLTKVEYEKAVDDLLVGVVLDLSGHNASFGQQILDGMESALSPLAREKLINQRLHYPLFHKMKLMVRDHGGDLEKGKMFVDELYTDHRAAVVVGGLSNLESQSYAEISSRRAKIFISLLPKTLLEFNEHSRSLSFASSYRWQLKIIAQHLKNQQIKHPTLIVSETTAQDQISETTAQQIADFSQSLSSLIIPDQVISVTDTVHKLNQDSQDHRHEHNKVIPSPLYVIAQDIVNSQVEVVVVTLGLRDSKELLEYLQKLSFQGHIYGLDYWDHPSFRPTQLNLNIHYVVQYDQNFLSDDFKELYYYHTQNQPTVLSALGYDVSCFILHLYQQTKTTRIPPFLRLMEKNQLIQAPASFAGQYRRSDHHFIERQMVLRSLKPRSQKVIGQLITPPHPQL